MIQESNGKYFHDGVEITESEYLVLLVEIKEKTSLVNNICNGIKTMDDVPTEWRNEIEQRVHERKTEEEPELTTEEALEIILGVAEL